MPYLDGESEFGEDRRKPIPEVDIGIDFVVAASEILDKVCPALTTRAERSL
jgi:hypothetical protein